MKLVNRFAICAVAIGTCLGLGAPTASALPGLPALPAPFSQWVTPPVPVEKALQKDFRALQKAMRKSMPGQTGIAVVPINGEQAISLGSLKAGRAWSTLKVPVSLAAERKLGYRILAKENKAITISDNEAAGELWGSLGGGRASVDAVTAVLREGRDTRTRVASEVDEPASYPGHTNWALADQARFAAHLPCMPGTENVIRLMSSVAPNQQWGLTKFGHGALSAVKGGWGPHSVKSPGYIVRQVGIVSTSRGQIAVALAAVPRSGKFEDGTAMLNRMGTWLGKYSTRLPVGVC